MKRIYYFLASVLIALISTGGAKAETGDVITSLDQLVNNKCYTIKCKRGQMVVNNSKTAICSSHYGNGVNTLDAASTEEADGKWALLTINGSGRYLYNLGTKMFVNISSKLVNNAAQAVTVDVMEASNPDGNYKFKIKQGSNTLNNNNSGGIALDGWSTEDNGNRLMITEAGDFDATPFQTTITVTYNYMLNGTKVYSDQKSTFATMDFPSPTKPAYVECSAPSGTVQASDNGKSFDITCTTAADMPFSISSDFASAKWYQVKIKRNPVKYAKFDGTNISNSTTAPETLATEDIFAFVGSPYGFNIYNAKAGQNAPFGPKTPVESNTIKASSTDDAAVFRFEISSENSNIHLFRNVENELAYLNDMNNKLGYWYSTNNLHDAGSDFDFIAVPDETVAELLGKTIAVTYNVYLNDTKLYSTTIMENKNEAPTFNLNTQSEYLDITGIPATITTGQTSYDIHTSYKADFPFQADKWYNLAIGRTPNLQIYTTTGVTDRIETQDVAKTTETWNNYLWRIEGDWYNGFRLYNHASQAYVSYGNTVNPGDKFQAYLTTADEPGSRFEYMPKNGKAHFRILNTTNDAYISNNGGSVTTFLTNWNTSANLTDAGAHIIITESKELSDDDVTLFTEALNNALTTVDRNGRIPVLFSADDVTTTKAELNAIICNKTSEVDAAIAQVNTILDNFYKKAEGKKFSARNVPDTYYLSASKTELQAKKAELHAECVFDVTYNANGKFYLHGVFNNVYSNKPVAYNVAPTTSATATDDFFIGILDNSSDNKVYFANVLTGYNSIHFSTSYTHNTCGWEYNAGNSQWILASVTDEQYEELSTWTLLDEAIAAAQQYSIGTGVGQFNGEGYAEALANAIAMREAHSATADEIAAAIAAISVDNLTLNMPANGQLIYIKDNAGNYMTCNNAENGRTAFAAEKNDAAIFCYTGSALISYKTGFYATHNGAANPFPKMAQEVIAESEATLYQIHASGLNKDKYAISFGSDTRFMYTAGNAGNFANAAAINQAGFEFTLEEVEALPVSISDAKIATLYSPMALQIPDGITAYTGTYNNDNNSIKLTMLSGIIPANTGVIIEGEPGNYTFTTTTGGEGTSSLTGTVAGMTTVSGVYTLQTVDGQLGFYSYTGENLNGFKAYFANNSGSQGFKLIKDNDMTGINSAEASIANEGKCYDLQGKPVAAPLKNQIYIVNGKKVIMK